MSPKAKTSKKKTAAASRKAASHKAARKTGRVARRIKSEASPPKSKGATGAKSKTAGRKKTPTASRGPAARKSTKAKKAKKIKKRVSASRKTKARPRLPRLTPKQMAHYRELLSTKQQELTAAYHIVKGDSRSDLDDGTEDYIDYAVHSYAREFLLSLTEMERKQLFLVEDALERLKRKHFGYCQHCRQTVHSKRLEVAPWARYCIPCQELDERGLLEEPFESVDADEGDELAQSDAGSDDELEDEDPDLVAEGDA